jgi:hypothetical protein
MWPLKHNSKEMVHERHGVSLPSDYHSKDTVHTDVCGMFFSLFLDRTLLSRLKLSWRKEEQR